MPKNIKKCYENSTFKLVLESAKVVKLLQKMASRTSFLPEFALFSMFPQVKTQFPLSPKNFLVIEAPLTVA